MTKDFIYQKETKKTIHRLHSLHFEIKKKSSFVKVFLKLDLYVSIFGLT